MKKWLAGISGAILLLALVVVIGLMTWEPLVARTGTAPPKAEYSAEIIRDEFGVPHIHGKRDRCRLWGRHCPCRG
ncbi:MAG: hypothetical protein R3E18_03240 [Sphingomonadaceae bacterium]